MVRRPRGLYINTNVEAGRFEYNHNETHVRDAAPGLKVQTNVKSGALDAYIKSGGEARGRATPSTPAT